MPSLTYYDSAAGHRRLKRRYVWSLCAFCTGLVAGLAIARLVH